MLEIRESDQFVNASVLCLSVKKQFSQYLLNQSTKDFLECLSKKLGIPKDSLVQKGERGKGKDQATWIHPTVAIHLGQWLSADNAAEAIAYLWDELEASKLAIAATKQPLKELEDRVKTAEKNAVEHFEKALQESQKIAHFSVRLFASECLIVTESTKDFVKWDTLLYQYQEWCIANDVPNYLVMRREFLRDLESHLYRKNPSLIRFNNTPQKTTEKVKGKPVKVFKGVKIDHDQLIAL